MANQEIHDFAVGPVNVPAGEMRAFVLVVDTTGIQFPMNLLGVSSDVGLIVGLAKNTLPLPDPSQILEGDTMSAIVHNPTGSPISATVTWEGQESSAAHPVE